MVTATMIATTITIISEFVSVVDDYLYTVVVATEISESIAFSFGASVFETLVDVIGVLVCSSVGDVDGVDAGLFVC